MARKGGGVVLVVWSRDTHGFYVAKGGYHVVMISFQVGPGKNRRDREIGSIRDCSVVSCTPLIPTADRKSVV